MLRKIEYSEGLLAMKMYGSVTYEFVKAPVFDHKFVHKLGIFHNFQPFDFKLRREKNMDREPISGHTAGRALQLKV